MSDSLRTVYVFELQVEGERAKQQAKQYRDEILKELQGGAAQGVARTSQSIANTTAASASAFDQFSNALRESSKQYWAFRRIGYDFEHMGRKLLTTAAALGATMYGLAQSYVELDGAVTRASMAMRLPAELMNSLTEAALDASIATAAFSPAQIAEGLRLWAAGTGEVVRSEEQLNRLVEDTIDIQKLAAINMVDFASSVDQVGGIMHEYGMTQQDVTHIVETLNFVSSESFANVDDLGNAFKMVGPLANELGVSFDQTAAALAVLSDNNVKGSMAGRAFREMLRSIIEPSAKYEETMNRILNVNRAAGESWKDIVFPEGEFVGLAKYIDLVAAATENLTGAERAMVVATMTNSNAIPTVISLLAQQNEARKYGVSALNAYEKVMLGVTDAETLAYKKMYEDITGLPFALEGAHARMTGQWEEYETSFEARMLRLQQRATAAFTKLGANVVEALVPALEEAADVLERLVDLLAENPRWADVAANGAVALTALGAVLLATGSIAQSVFMIKSVAPALGIALRGLVAALSGSGISTWGGAAAAATVTKMGAAGVAITPTTMAGIISTIGTGVALGALVAVVGAVAVRLLSKEKREEAAELVRGYGPQAEEYFEKYFTGALSGATYVTKDPAAAALIKELRESGAIGGIWDEHVWNMPTPLSAIAFGGALDFISARDLQTFMDEMTRRQRASAEAKAMSSVYAESSGGGGTAYLHANALARISSERYLSDEEIAENQRRAKAYYEYEQEKVRIHTTFATRRRQIEDAFNQWEASAYANMLSRMKSLDDNYLLKRTRSEEDLQNSIADVRDSAYKRDEEAERAHHESLRSLQVDHAQRMVDLLEARDVAGITKEMRTYSTRMDEQSRSFSTQREKSAEDAAERIAKLEANEHLKAVRAEEDYQASRLELADDYHASLVERQERLQADLAENQAEYEQALVEATDAAYLAVADLDPALDMLYSEMLEGAGTFTLDYAGKWRAMAHDVEDSADAILSSAALTLAILDDMPSWLGRYDIPAYEASSRSVPSRAAGGYVSGGLYSLHAGEFVLSPATTREMESRYGHLSQDIFKGQSEPQFVFSPVFNGMGGQDKAWFRRAAEQVFDEKMAVLQRRVR